MDSFDANQGDQFVASIFGGNDTNAVASAPAGGGGLGDVLGSILGGLLGGKK